MLIVATSLSNHPNDKQEAEPTLDALSPRLGKPAAAALDNGFFSEHNILALEQRSIEPYTATGREAHHKDLNTLLGSMAPMPPDDATPLEKMAYKLSTKRGKCKPAFLTAFCIRTRFSWTAVSGSPIIVMRNQKAVKFQVRIESPTQKTHYKNITMNYRPIWF